MNTKLVRFLVALLASLSLALGGMAVMASPADASTGRVTVKNSKASKTRAEVHQISNGWRVKNGVVVAPGKTGSFTQKTGPGKDGCTILVPGGWQAKVYQVRGGLPWNLRNIVNKKTYDRHMVLENGNCAGTWNVKLTQKYHFR